MDHDRAGAPPRTVGVITCDTSGSFYGTMLDGIVRRARERGVRCVVMRMAPGDVVASQLAAESLDGWIVVFHTDAVTQLAAGGRPVVTLSNAVPGIPSVLIDNAGATAQLVEHLIRLGHRRIAFAGWLESFDPQERLAGYRSALERHGIGFDERLVFPAPDSHLRGGRAVAEQMLRAGIDFTAIVAATDFNALAIMEVLEQAGYRFPEDLAITGFDDIPEAQARAMPLTTVRLRFAEMGGMALDALLDLASGGAPPSTLRCPTTPVIRRSCGSSEPDAQDTADAATAGETWRAQLRRQLVALAVAPEPLPRDRPLEAVWPGATTLVEALAAALDAAPPPDDAALRRAWVELAEVTVYGVTHSHILETLAAAAVARLAEVPLGDERRDRVAGALSRLRAELISVCVEREIGEREQRFALTHSIEAANTAIAAGDDVGVAALGWMRHTSAARACFGIWREAGSERQLTVAGTYLAGSAAAGGELPPGPFSLARLEWQPESEIALVVPVRTARRDWGLLAVALRYDSRSGLDARAAVWAGMMGARLDQLALVHELEREREVLRASYARERSLADTVRELGCPIIPLGREAMLVPLIGSIDSRRAQQITDAVLAAVGELRSIQVLLDVSGVAVIDTQVARVLLQLAQMVGLLGARVTLIGVRPEIAQSIVGLGVDLSSLTAHASLDLALRESRADVGAGHRHPSPTPTR